MDVVHCVLASNEYIVRNQELKLVESVRNQLLRMDDLKSKAKGTSNSDRCKWRPVFPKTKGLKFDQEQEVHDHQWAA
jgi:hypothetical protein